MNKTEWNERMFDAMLKLACEESLDRELENVSKVSAINPVTPSKEFEKRMDKLIRTHSRQIRYKKAVKAFGRVASAILIVMGIAFSIVLSAQAVRSQILRTITEWGEGFVDFSFKKEELIEDDSDGLLRPTYLPTGFSESSIFESENNVQVEYRNDKQQRLNFFRISKDTGHLIQIDSDHSIERYENIKGTNVQIFDASAFASDESSYLIWESEDEFFILSANYSIDELRKVAESIIVQIAQK